MAHYKDGHDIYFSNWCANFVSRGLHSNSGAGYGFRGGKKVVVHYPRGGTRYYYSGDWPAPHQWWYHKDINYIKVGNHYVGHRATKTWGLAQGLHDFIEYRRSHGIWQGNWIETQSLSGLLSASVHAGDIILLRL